MKVTQLFRYVIGFIALITFSAQLSAMPVSIATSTFDWLSFTVSGDTSLDSAELETEIFLSSPNNDVEQFAFGDELFSSDLDIPTAFGFAGNDGNDFFQATSLVFPENSGSYNAEANLYSIVPFINNSFGDVGVSIDYELFGLTGDTSAASSANDSLSLAIASAELSIFDEFFNELDTIGDDIFVQSTTGNTDSNDVFGTFDLFLSSLDEGNYFAVLTNSALSIVDINDAVAVPEPGSIFLMLMGLVLLASVKNSTHSSHKTLSKNTLEKPKSIVCLNF